MAVTLLSETFDGAITCYSGGPHTCDNTWPVTIGAGWTCNYNTSPAPIRGVYSCYCNPAIDAGTNYSVSPTFTATDPCYAFFKINIGGVGNSATSPGIFMGIDDAVSRGVYLGIRGTPTYNFCLGDGSLVADTAYPVILGTTYYIWLEYHKGSGSNAVAKLYISTNSTKPGSANATISTGTGKNSCNRFYMQFWRTSAVIGVWNTVLDDIFVSDTDITTDPFLAGPSNLKTWNGLAKASIKTMNGLAIASVKNWEGLA